MVIVTYLIDLPKLISTFINGLKSLKALVSPGDEYWKEAAKLLATLMFILFLPLGSSMIYLGLLLVISPGTQNQLFFVGLSLFLTIGSYWFSIPYFIKQLRRKRGSILRSLFQLHRRRDIRIVAEQLKYTLYEWILGLEEPNPKALIYRVYLPYVTLTGLKYAILLFLNSKLYLDIILLLLKVISFIIIGPPLGALSVLSVDYIIGQLMRIDKLIRIDNLESGALQAKLLILIWRSLWVAWAAMNMLVLFPLIVYGSILTDIINFQLLTSIVVYIYGWSIKT